jgi:transposase
MVVDMYFQGRHSCDEIFRMVSDLGAKCHFCKRTVYNIIEEYKRLGHVFGSGRLKVFGWTHGQQTRIVDWCLRHKQFYLKELRLYVLFVIGRFVSLACLSLLLRRVGISHTKIKRIPGQRSEARRLMYRERMIARGYRQEHLIFLDETGSDLRNWTRKYGWAQRGTKSKIVLPSVRGKRITAVAALGFEGLLSVELYTGKIDRHAFRHYLADSLLPLTNPWPEPCSVIVMDNAAIYKADHNFVRDMCGDFGVRVEFLEPYWCDDNPIENLFSTAKSGLEAQGHVLQAMANPVPEIKLIFFQSGTPRMAANYFRRAGYDELDNLN